MPAALRILTLILFLIGLLASVHTARFWYDDTGHSRVAIHLSETGDWCYPTDSETGACDPLSAFVTAGPVMHFTAAAFLNISGPGFIELRYLMTMITVLCMFIFFGLARGLTDSQKAWWAMLILVGNIQLLTYGVQYLGEVPGGLFMLAGLWGMLRWLDKGSFKAGAFVLLSFAAACLVKAYFAFIISGGILIWLILEMITKKNRRLLIWFPAVVILPLIPVLFEYLRINDQAAFAEWWSRRTAYSGEFLAFGFSESLRFLLFKPLVLLGLIAMVVRVRVKQMRQDRLMLAFELALLLFFLASPGSDRFGMLLLFLPAIYVAEFVRTAYDKWTDMGRRGGRTVILLSLLLLLFWQQSLWRIPQRLMNPELVNAAEKELSRKLVKYQGKIFSYDEQIVPFLDSERHYRLNDRVPHAASGCEPESFDGTDLFVEGIYARTVFNHCIDYSKLEKSDSTGGGEDRYVIYRVLSRVKGTASNSPNRPFRNL